MSFKEKLYNIFELFIKILMFLLTIFLLSVWGAMASAYLGDVCNSLLLYFLSAFIVVCIILCVIATCCNIFQWKKNVKITLMTIFTIIFIVFCLLSLYMIGLGHMDPYSRG